MQIGVGDHKPASYRWSFDGDRSSDGGKRDSVTDAVIGWTTGHRPGHGDGWRTSGLMLWDVIRNEMSLREYASRMACNGVSLNVHNVKGRLNSALDILVGHYKLV